MEKPFWLSLHVPLPFDKYWGVFLTEGQFFHWKNLENGSTKLPFLQHASRNAGLWAGPALSLVNERFQQVKRRARISYALRVGVCWRNTCAAMLCQSCHLVSGNPMKDCRSLPCLGFRVVQNKTTTTKKGWKMIAFANTSTQTSKQGKQTYKPLLVFSMHGTATMLVLAFPILLEEIYCAW